MLYAGVEISQNRVWGESLFQGIEYHQVLSFLRKNISFH